MLTLCPSTSLSPENSPEAQLHLKFQSEQDSPRAVLCMIEELNPDERQSRIRENEAIPQIVRLIELVDRL